MTLYEYKCEECGTTYMTEDIEASYCPNCKEGIELNEHNTDGSKTDFYDIGNCKDVDDLCHHWNMNFFEGNILKALVGMAKGRKGNVRHSGTSYERDLNKAKHYIDKLIKIKKDSK